jgi:hypothetical protein
VYVSGRATRGLVAGETKCDEETDAKRKRVSFLLQRTTPTAGLRRIRIVTFANRTPHRWNLHTGTRHQYRHEEVKKRG